MVIRATECCLSRLRERTSGVVYLQIRGQKGKIVDKPDIRNYWLCFIVQLLNKLQTGNPILVLVLHPQKMNLLPCVNFGKRQEKAILCQTEMWVNTTDSHHTRAKYSILFSFYFKSKNTSYIRSEWKLTSLYFKGDSPHFPTLSLRCPPCSVAVFRIQIPGPASSSFV